MSTATGPAPSRHEAGYNPASARAGHGHWFAFLDDAGLLTEREREVARRHGDVLAGFEKEAITKSYKLVAIAALLQIGALRAGADVAEVAWTARKIVTGDPRLIADTRSEEMPDPASASAEDWRGYWLKWPLSAWAGRLRGGSSSSRCPVRGRRGLQAVAVQPSRGSDLTACGPRPESLQADDAAARVGVPGDYSLATLEATKRHQTGRRRRALGSRMSRRGSRPRGRSGLTQAGR